MHPKRSWGSSLKTHWSQPLSKEAQHLLLALEHVMAWSEQLEGS